MNSIYKNMLKNGTEPSYLEWKGMNYLSSY